MTSPNAPPPPPPLFRAARAGGAIGLSTVGALIAGFFLQLAIAFTFGAGGETDAFFMAQGTSELLAKILLGGSLTSVFLPVFIEYVTRGDPARAWRLANNIFHVAAVAFVLALVVLELFADPLVSLIAPGFAPDIHRTTVVLLRIMLPAFFFSMLTELATAILHSFRVFGIPAASRLITPLLSLLLLVTAASRVGIAALAIGALAGASLQMFLILRALFRTGFRYAFVLSLRDRDLLRVLRLVAPFAISVLAAQGAGVVYRVLVSHLAEGSLSALKFGEKLYTMTNHLFLTSITTVTFPAFARAVAARIAGEIRDTARRAARFMIFLGVPLTLGIMLLRTPLVRVLYERGSFTSEDTAATAAVLGLLLIGLVANGLSSLLGHLALALKVTHVSVSVTAIAHGVSTLLFILLTPRLGIRGLALATAITPFILALLYLAGLRRRVPRLWAIFADPGLVKFAASGIALAAGVTLGQRLASPLEGNLAGDVATILAGTLLGVIAYGSAALALRIPEIRAAREIVYYAVRKLRP